MDLQYLLFLQGLRETAPAWLNGLLYFISEASVNGVLVLYVLLLYWCLDKRAGFFLLFCQSGATALNQLVKNTACVYRPWIRDPRVQVAANAAGSATGYSFPSGHTTNAMACYGGTALWQKKRKPVVVIMLVLALLTGFARNWLCAHTPQDVCVALLLSGAFVLLAAKGLAWVEAHPGQQTRVVVAALAVVAAMLLYIEVKPYPLDYLPDGSLLVDPFRMKTDCYKAYGIMMGLLLGWYAEVRWVHFTVAGRLPTRAVRFAVGAVCALALQTHGPAAFTAALGTNWGIFAIHLLAMLFIVAGYPALFTAVERRLTKEAAAS